MNPARLAYGAAMAGYFGLLGLWLLWNTVLASPSPQRYPAALALMATTLPMLPLLRGLLYNRRSIFVWLGLLSLPYFIHGVGAVVDVSQRLPAALEIAFSLSLFGGSLARLRILAR